MDVTAFWIAASVVSGLAVVWAFVRGVGRPEGEHAPVAALAARLGLARGVGSPPEFRDHRDQVRIALRSVGGAWELSYAHRDPTDLTCGPADAAALGDVHTSTGDTAFDGVVSCSGDPLPILMALAPPVRARLREAVRAGWTATKGTWVIEVDPQDASLDAPAIHEAGLALAVATGGMVEDVDARLVARAREESDPGARRRLVDAIGDRPEGRILLSRLVIGSSRPAVRGLALRRLADSHADHPETVAGVALLAAAADRLESELVIALAIALRSVAHADAEAVLLRLLGHDEPAARAVVIASLESLGTPSRAVPALVPLRDGAGGELARRAGLAIAAIQSRVGERAAGRLALVDAHAGGELALIEDDPIGS